MQAGASERWETDGIRGRGFRKRFEGYGDGYPAANVYSLSPSLSLTVSTSIMGSRPDERESLLTRELSGSVSGASTK